MLKRQPAALKMPPVERTKQFDVTPDVAERMAAPATGPKPTGPSAAIDPGQKAPTAATVKWEPPKEFQARLADGTRSSSPCFRLRKDRRWWLRRSKWL